ncbi:MAG: AEC family transporter [Firmicutes bacterium]|nr:AEC family transporter [Bacillota bacterium]
MGFSEIINSLAMIMVMIMPGFVLKKMKVFQNAFYEGLSYFTVNLCIPALIIHSLQVPYSKDLLLELGKTFVLWLPMLVVATLASIMFVKAFGFGRKQLSLALCMLMVPNTGFVGIPLINQLYGSESMFYASACEIVGDIFCYSIVFSIIAWAAGKQSKFSIKELLSSPPILALVIGIILFVAGISLPSFIATPVNYFSTATAPLALFVLGSRLGELSLKDFAGDKRIYVLCFIRLIIMPAIAYLIVRVLLKDTSLFGIVFILMQGMPAASVTVIVSQTYNSDVDFATKGVMLSTVLCLFTLPIFALIL